MANYWLTPVKDRNPFTLGAERFICMPQAEVDGFRAAMHAIHPWLMPMFKASALESGTEDNACGGPRAAASLLDRQGDLAFDGQLLELSACGRAFAGKLSLPSQTFRLLHLLTERQNDCRTDSGDGRLLLSKQGAVWVRTMQEWASLGWTTILLREETS